MIDLGALGEHVRTLRKSREMTQEELAEKSQLSITMIRTIESRQGRNISVQTLNKISEALDISMTELLAPFDSRYQYNELLQEIAIKPNPQEYVDIFLKIMNIK